jgi:aspartyl protease family protein
MSRIVTTAYRSKRPPRKRKPVTIAGPAIVLGLGLLGGCAQQFDRQPRVDSYRQSRVDSYCETPSASGGSAEGIAQCRRYFQNPAYSPPRDAPATYYPSPTAYPSATANYSPPLVAKQPPAQGRTEVALSRDGGTVTVPVVINGALRLGCIVDSGASNVVLPADVVMTLLRTGTLRNSDFLGKQTYVLADGSKLPSLTFRIRSLKVGDRVLEDVTGSASPVSGEPLLGQSFLSRFQSWSIDNARGVLVLE